MADLVQLSDELSRSVARQVGDRIAEEYASAPDAVHPDPVDGVARPSDFSPLAGVDVAAAEFRLAETFEVWRLRDGAEKELGTTGEDLVTLARQTGAYRHLIRLAYGGAERAVAFAQSVVRVGAPDERVVRDFYFSPLAAELDEAVMVADKVVPEEAVTRLLCLPELKVEALWFVTTAAAPASRQNAGAPPTRYITTRGVIVASAPPRFPEPTMSLISSTAFVRALAGMSQGMGLLL